MWIFLLLIINFLLCLDDLFICYIDLMVFDLILLVSMGNYVVESEKQR